MSCPICKKQNYIKKGFYISNAIRIRKIQRYYCHFCKKTFSQQTNTLAYKDKKPALNHKILRLVTKGVSQRACAELLDINRHTVARKIIKMSRFADAERLRQLDKHSGDTVVFDEQETFEHTKCKPLSIPLAVSEGSRRILSIDVAQMPAKGHLAAVSRKKYGYRADHRRDRLSVMMGNLKRLGWPIRLLKSDENPRYGVLCRKYFPHVTRETSKGRRGCVVGQGELKALVWDPLFSLNHTCAMIRDNLKCMSRRTWCTTKKPSHLLARLQLYAFVHNFRLDNPGERVCLDLGTAI